MKSSGHFSRPGAKNRGFTYVGLLFAVVVFGLASVGAVRILASSERGERERQLLFVGHEFRQAIRSYYESGPGAWRYPARLEDLLGDSRFPGVKRHLRRIYDDPITGQSEWGLIKAPEGGIMGVYSLSEREPLKRADFDAQDIGFDEPVFRAAATKAPLVYRYTDWKFLHRPVYAVGPPGRGTTPGR